MIPGTPPLSRRNSQLSESSHGGPSATAGSSPNQNSVSPAPPELMVNSVTSAATRAALNNSVDASSSVSGTQNDPKQPVRFEVAHQPQEECFVEMTTGLLSLSVHEPLTFNGTEIALHPDLFANYFSFQQQQPGLECAPLFSSAKSSIDSAVFPTPNVASDIDYADGASTQTGEAQRKRKCMLEPGDLIEIRVWDTVKDPSSAYAASRVLRPNGNKQSQPIEGERPLAASGGLSRHETLSATAAEVGIDPLLSRGQESLQSDQNTTQTAHPSAETETTTSGALSFPFSSYLHKTRTDVPYGSKILMEFPSTSHASGGTGVGPDEDHGIKSSASTKVYELRTSFVMKVGEHSLAAIKENSRSQISMLRQGM